MNSCYREIHLSPEIGRFVSSDGDPGTLEEPLSLNSKYLYVENDPVGFADPSGDSRIKFYGNHCGVKYGDDANQPINELDDACRTHDTYTGSAVGGGEYSSQINRGQADLKMTLHGFGYGVTHPYKPYSSYAGMAFGTATLGMGIYQIGAGNAKMMMSSRNPIEKVGGYLLWSTSAVIGGAVFVVGAISALPVILLENIGLDKWLKKL